MDYKKLVHVTDSLTSEHKIASAPKVSKTRSGNPLDNMEIRDKIADAKKNEPAKVIILDDAQITKIMTAPREQKRKLLSRLTDSQRRRVLTRYRELTKVQDAEESVLDLFTLDSAINNALYAPDEYNLNMLSKVISSVDVPADVAAFVTAVQNEDRDGVNANIDAYKSFMESQGVQSTVQVPEVLQDSITDSVTPENMEKIVARANEDVQKALAESDVDMFDAVDETVAELVNEGLGDYTSVSEAYFDAWNDAFNQHKGDASAALQDSINKLKAQLTARKVMDAVIDQIAESPLLDNNGEEIVPDEERSILEVLSEAIEEFANGDDNKLKMIAATTISGDPISTEAEEPTEEPTEEPVDESEEEFEDEEAGASSDALVDKSEDDSEDETEEHVQDSFTAEGLQHEAADINEVMNNIEVINEKEDEEYAKELKKLQKMINNQSHETCEHHKSVFDCVRLARSIVNKSIDLALVDSLRNVVPSLKNYTFVADDAIPFYTINDPQASVANPPLTHDEYQSIAPAVPSYFPLVVESYSCPQCSACESYTPQDGYIQVLSNGVQQNYYPIQGSVQEICDLLGCADSKDYTSIINKNCKPVSHVFHVAALTNNLSVIDSRFYKKHLNDSVWHFDEVPACLSEFTNKPGSIQIVRDSENAISLYGVKFVLN